ncbi:hypothetical protein C5167_037101 [Papaver somniferum]|uniref:F-box domain-containing protein n=1 Tax=Papaver somniferum TaxID=3469 RepID=A0A4Y7I5D4_PAPSO|nr:F-box/LRR-repeat protein At3g59200-like [Papaver somniferum]RZC44143.1 hypothetical protein C5167_037101 [Papaver somniferum]
MNVVGEDRISKLPDTLLHHILSFLPTKCAVSTSILWKRWKDVWVYVPVLDFLYWEPPRIIFNRYEGNDEEAIILETNNFMDFVDRILLLRNMVNINNFCLNCESGFFDHTRVNAWITTAINCGVEEFIFSGSYSYPSNGRMIPDSLFTSETLTKLDFQIQEQDRLDLPESISLPRLKILRLTNIVYHDKKLAGKLFSSCPVLEELCLANGGLQNFYRIRVSAPTLKSFSLTCCLRSNMGDVMPVKVKINAPNLTSLTLSNWLPEDFSVHSFPLLQDAELYYNFSDIKTRFIPLSNFIMKLCNVKVLKLSGIYFEVLKLAQDLSTGFPTFVYFRHIYLNLKPGCRLNLFFSYSCHTIE